MNKKTQAELARIIRRFSGRTIGVLGDFMLDEVLCGEATRISPEAPVPVVLMDGSHVARTFLGGAGNVVANLRALGARPVPYGAIGRDATGKELRRLLESRRVSSKTLVEERGRITPRKVRIAAHQHQLLRLDFEKPAPIAPRTTAEVVCQFKRTLRRLDALIISDYQKGSATTELCREITSLALERRLPVFVDPKPQHSEICRHATAITPNLHEAELMAGVALKDGRWLESAGRRLLAELDCQYLLVTRGGEGMTLFESPGREGRSGATHEIASVPRPVYDVTGAGDTVVAVLALAYTSGATMREAAELANLAAGRVVLKFGTSEVRPQELLQAVAESAQD
ncbi:MAG TPA: PfkB family carbohydrate kinase [Terriglobia bacterium]|nr:PfkB family carbohydrate kinase [Terriglobia bacterium]